MLHSLLGKHEGTVTELVSTSSLDSSSSFLCVFQKVVFAGNSVQADWRLPARKARFKTSSTLLTHHHPTGPSRLLPVLRCKGFSLEVWPTVHHPAQPMIG